MADDARAVRGGETRERILDATRAELARSGLGLTLDAVAARLSMTKQAVLYHFPSRDRLLVALALEGVAEESDAMIAAVKPARSGADAARRFVRASLRFHLGDLQRFRLMYMLGGAVRRKDKTISLDDRRKRLYPVTARMYDALEEKLRADPRVPKRLDLRRVAVGLHLSALGFATMATTVTEAGDGMTLPIEAYAYETLEVIARGLGEKG